MDMEDQSEIDYQLDLDEDSSVIFDIPEEILEIDQDFGSDSGSLGYLDEDDGSLEPDGSDSGDGSGDNNLPEIITQLQDQLLKGYTLPPCPTQAPRQHGLSKAETLSLHHYVAWTESNGTVKAYNSHARVLTEATKEEILSLHKVRQLALDLAGLRPSFVDMCPKSCMAFTGSSQSEPNCTYSHKGNVCNESRYQPHQHLPGLN
jgi:hypothetical protein